MSKPDLSIVVVTHEGRELALRTLRSAHAALGPIRAEWFVVDAESTDGVADAIEAEFDDVRVLRRPNQGFAASNNVGLRLAQGRYVLLLNPDVEVCEGTLAELVATMDARPWRGMASVVQRGPGGEFQPSVRRFPSPARSLGEALFAARWPIFDRLQELDTRRAAYTVERPIDWAVGAFLIARTEAVREVGPLDEQFFLYSEEIDWCYRFWQAGWPVALVPTMTVTHHAGGRSRGDLMAQLSHSRLIFAGKHYGRLRRGGIRAALGLGHVIRIGFWGPISRVRPAERGRVAAELAGLRVVFGRAAPPLGPYADGGRAAGMRPGTAPPAPASQVAPASLVR
ncbi:MAG TPA: glycosyltransferase family 2 protein [Solirubrobacterales bacterium]|nr:glycosyltransferase family 2 protein [Solirubrobacterales bacterium]